MSQPHLQVGWIGLGSMGLAMASNIQRHLLSQDAQPIRYWNRTISRGDDLKANGGIPCSSIADVVHGSGIIFISVRHQAAIEVRLIYKSVGQRRLSPHSSRLPNRL